MAVSMPVLDGRIQTAVTAYFSSEQYCCLFVLLFVFARRAVLDGRRDSCNSKTNRNNSSKQLLLFAFAVCQRQAAVTAYSPSKQLLLFVFARRSVCQYSMAEEIPAAQRQTAVNAYFSSKHLLLFTFTRCCLTVSECHDKWLVKTSTRR